MVTPPKSWIRGREVNGRGQVYDKYNPATGEKLYTIQTVDRDEVQDIFLTACKAQAEWSNVPAVVRGERLFEFVNALNAHKQELSDIMCMETGKSNKIAIAEIQGAIALGRFMAGEGQRMFGRTIPSSVKGRWIQTRREPRGVAVLIVSANTPIANIAWKVFPALICGNATILKPSEDAPATAFCFGKIFHNISGFPSGIFQIAQGVGQDLGEHLVTNPLANIVSFTGSTKVGIRINELASRSLKRISLELGGKNAMVVCESADIDWAVNCAIYSSFSNAGQRCSATSRLLVHASIQDKFFERFVERMESLKLGTVDIDDFGPVINIKQKQKIERYTEEAKSLKANVFQGGVLSNPAAHKNGYFVNPTLIQDISLKTSVWEDEIFGPVVCSASFKTIDEAISMVNASSYGLTAAVHTGNLSEAMLFVDRVRTGIVSVNGNTFGSEPHLPFGGLGLSGNGTREPGTEALDVYSELKNIYLNPGGT